MWAQIVEEDRAMVQSLQHNMSADRFRPGRMSNLERTVHNIVTRYLDRLLDAPQVKRSVHRAAE